MTRFTIILALTAALVTGACRSRTPPATKPAETKPQPVPAAKAPAAKPPAKSPATLRQGPQGPGARPQPATATAPAVSNQARKLLDELEAAGRKYPAIRAEILYEVVNPKLGDSETRTGWTAYQRAGKNTPARFRIHFDTLRQGPGRKVRSEVDYALDGKWLTVAKHRIKQMTRYEIAGGQKSEPLKLGKGPFPLPFGQEADDVIRFFLPTTRPLRDGEPKGADYLKLVPRPRYLRRMSFVRMEMWIDPKHHLPVKLISRDHAGSITTVAFRNIQNPKSFPAEMFRLPRKAGWTYTEKPLEQ